MAEYISREDILDIASQYCPDDDGSCSKADVDLREMLDEIEALPVADVQPAPQWISVEDRLPEIGKSVLIYYPYWSGDEIQVAKLDSDGMTFDICGEFNIGTGAVTHWQPFPKPPKEGDTNG